MLTDAVDAFRVVGAQQHSQPNELGLVHAQFTRNILGKVLLHIRLVVEDVPARSRYVSAESILGWIGCSSTCVLAYKVWAGSRCAAGSSITVSQCPAHVRPHFQLFCSCFYVSTFNHIQCAWMPSASVDRILLSAHCTPAAAACTCDTSDMQASLRRLTCTRGGRRTGRRRCRLSPRRPPGQQRPATRTAPPPVKRVNQMSPTNFHTASMRR